MQGFVVALLALFIALQPAALAQEATPGASDAIHLQDGDVPLGTTSVDTPSGERIGRAALAAHLQAVNPSPPIDPTLDALARDQLRAAIEQAAVTGTLPAARLSRPAPDTLVRVGVVGVPASDGQANMFSQRGPNQADATGSAGGVVTLRNAVNGAEPGYVALVAAAAWRDAQLAPLDDLTATFGAPPTDLDATAAQRWLDQENRVRTTNGFPTELLARRNPVLDREAENIMRGARGEPALPPIVDLPPGIEPPGQLHANSRTCEPNCEPFWTAPDGLIDVYRQANLEDHLAPGRGSPWLLNFGVYTQQQRWLKRYWDSYRLFGIAARVRTNQAALGPADAVRQAVDSLAPGGTDTWGVREYPVDLVVVGSDPWPT